MYLSYVLLIMRGCIVSLRQRHIGNGVRCHKNVILMVVNGGITAIFPDKATRK